MERRAGHAGQDPPAGDGTLLAVLALDEAHASVWCDGHDLGIGADVGALSPGGEGEFAGDGAHAADGNIPASVALADEVVEEAAVLLEVRVVGPREGADEGVREEHAAHEVARVVVLDDATDGLLDHRVPHALCALVARGENALTGLAPRRERVEQGGPERLGEHAAVLGEQGELLGIRRCTDAGEGGGRALGVVVRDEKARLAARRGIGGVRGDRAGREGEVEAELLDDAGWEQAHEVRVARQFRVHAGERLGGDGRPAHLREPLEDEDALAGATEVGRRDEGVVSAPDDDRVVVVPHAHGHARCGAHSLGGVAVFGGTLVVCHPPSLRPPAATRAASSAALRHPFALSPGSPFARCGGSGPPPSRAKGLPRGVGGRRGSDQSCSPVARSARRIGVHRDPRRAIHGAAISPVSSRRVTSSGVTHSAAMTSLSCSVSSAVAGSRAT